MYRLTTKPRNAERHRQPDGQNHANSRSQYDRKTRLKQYSLNKLYTELIAYTVKLSINRKPKINMYKCTVDQELLHIQRANDVTRARRASRQATDAAAERREDVMASWPNNVWRSSDFLDRSSGLDVFLRDGEGVAWDREVAARRSW